MSDGLRDLIDWLVEEGIKSVHKHETRPESIRGCLHGFELVRTMEPTLEAYEAVLRERQAQEHRMIGDVDAETYWEHVCATAQIRHVYERLKVIRGGPQTLISGLAMMQLHDYLKAKAQQP